MTAPSPEAMLAWSGVDQARPGAYHRIVVRTRSKGGAPRRTYPDGLPASGPGARRTHTHNRAPIRGPRETGPKSTARKRDRRDPGAEERPEETRARKRKDAARKRARIDAARNRDRTGRKGVVGRGRVVTTRGHVSRETSANGGTAGADLPARPPPSAKHRNRPLATGRAGRSTPRRPRTGAQRAKSGGPLEWRTLHP